MDQVAKLTKQENKIAHLVAKGFSEKEIASMLFVAYGTVHTHTRNIRRKTGARNIADITRNYILSLVDPRNVLLAFAFCVIQLGMVFSGNDFDARRVRTSRGNRIVKVRRNEA